MPATTNILTPGAAPTPGTAPAPIGAAELFAALLAGGVTPEAVGEGPVAASPDGIAPVGDDRPAGDESDAAVLLPLLDQQMLMQAHVAPMPVAISAEARPLTADAPATPIETSTKTSAPVSRKLPVAKTEYVRTSAETPTSPSDVSDAAPTAPAQTERPAATPTGKAPVSRGWTAEPAKKVAPVQPDPRIGPVAPVETPDRVTSAPAEAAPVAAGKAPISRVRAAEGSRPAAPERTPAAVKAPAIAPAAVPPKTEPVDAGPSGTASTIVLPADDTSVGEPSLQTPSTAPTIHPRPAPTTAEWKSAMVAKPLATAPGAKAQTADPTTVKQPRSPQTAAPSTDEALRDFAAPRTPDTAKVAVQAKPIVTPADVVVSAAPPIVTPAASDPIAPAASSPAAPATSNPAAPAASITVTSAESLPVAPAVNEPLAAPEPPAVSVEEALAVEIAVDQPVRRTPASTTPVKPQQPTALPDTKAVAPKPADPVSRVIDPAKPLDIIDQPSLTSVQPTGQPTRIDASSLAPVQPNVAAALADKVLDLGKDGKWIDQLARDIANVGSAGSDGTMRFRLAPEQLGALKVEITQSDQGARVHFQASSEAAQQVLSDAVPRLAAEARAQGVRIADTQVSFTGGSGTEAQQQGDNAGRQRAQTAQQDANVRTLRNPHATHTDATAPERRRSDRYA